MAAKASVIAAIQVKVGSKHDIYRIGLTHDLDERKAYWKDTAKETVTYWSNWTADSLSDAQDIEAHFIKKGMQGVTDGDLSAYKTVYVFVF